MNFLNEKDPHAAQWLRNLIGLGELPDGVVDERSIVDLRGADLDRYDELHFFAGIGVWARAVAEAEEATGRRLARPLFTGSCPCQPLSVAGQRQGHVDERHLWPAFHRLIAERRPATILGEQVAGKDGREWMAAVRHDLEASGYAVGCAVLPAGGFGAPHLRYRLFWVAQSCSAECGSGRPGWIGEAGGRPHVELAGSGAIGHVANAESERERPDEPRRNRGDRVELVGSASWRDGRDNGAAGGVANSDRERLEGEQLHVQPGRSRQAVPEAAGRGQAGGLADAASARPQQAGEHQRGPSSLSARSAEHGGIGGWPGSPDSFWSDADWIFCRDGKWRPIEPGSFPLVDGSAFRVGSGGPYEGMSRAGMLRGYGNAVVLPVARAFVEAVMEVCQ